MLLGTSAVTKLSKPSKQLNFLNLFNQPQPLKPLQLLQQSSALKVSNNKLRHLQKSLCCFRCGFGIRH